MKAISLAFAIEILDILAQAQLTADRTERALKVRTRAPDQPAENFDQDQ